MMSYFNLSAFLENKNIPPFVLGAFLSRSILKSNTVYTEVSFKASTYSQMDLGEYKDKYLQTLNVVSAPFKWYLCETSESSFKARLFLINDLNLDKERFFYKLYYKTVTDFEWLLENGLNDKKKDLIRGFMELRGSIDTTAQYVAQDYYYDDVFESKKYKILTDFCNVPYYVINLNFRDLQRQYYEGVVKRNTQFRINCKWYMKYIGMYNAYKADIFANTHSSHDRLFEESQVLYFNETEPQYNLSNGVDDRFNFYLHNILGRRLSDEEITSLRERLGYTAAAGAVRDPSLPEMIRRIEPDECVSCKDIYNINDRTFTHKRTNRPYFEIHHVISLGNNRELDDENNLVKLCPVCHGCLKRGVGTQSEQKDIIAQILNNSQKALSFCEKLFDTNDRTEIINKIYTNLK